MIHDLSGFPKHAELEPADQRLERAERVTMLVIEWALIPAAAVILILLAVGVLP